jgi:hypothetical protein
VSAGYIPYILAVLLVALTINPHAESPRSGDEHMVQSVLEPGCRLECPDSPRLDARWNSMNPVTWSLVHEMRISLIFPIPSCIPLLLAIGRSSGGGIFGRARKWDYGLFTQTICCCSLSLSLSLSLPLICSRLPVTLFGVRRRSGNVATSPVYRLWFIGLKKQHPSSAAFA